MSIEQSSSKQKKMEEWSKAFGQLTIQRIESLLNNPDLSQSQRRILENLLKKQKKSSS